MIAMGRHPAVPDNEAECVAYFKSVIEGLPTYREAAVIGPDKATAAAPKPREWRKATQ